MIEIHKLDESQFLRVRETLTRLGMLKVRTGFKPKLYQTAYIYHKKEYHGRGRYYIAHFRELYALDGAPNNELTAEDRQRLNNIVSLLVQWGLVKAKQFEPVYDPDVSLVVVKYKHKHAYDLIPPYKFGENHG